MGMGEPLAKQKQARCVLGNDLVATLATLSPPITCVFLASKSRHQSLFAALADRVAKRFKCNFEWMNFDEQQLRSVEERNQIPQMMYRPRTTAELVGHDKWFPALFNRLTHNRLTEDGKIPLYVLTGQSGVGKSSSIETTLLYQLAQSKPPRSVELHTVDCTLAFRPTKVEISSGEYDADDCESTDSIMRKVLAAMKLFINRIGMTEVGRPTDLFIVNFDSLENASTLDSAWLTWIAQCAFLASRCATNIVLVGSCNDWYMPRNTFLRALRDGSVSTLESVEIKVPLVSTIAMSARLSQWFPTLSETEIKTIAERAQGRMSVAVQMAANPKITLDIDASDSSALVVRTRAWIYDAAKRLDDLGNTTTKFVDPPMPIKPRPRLAVPRKFQVPTTEMLQELEAIDIEEWAANPLRVSSLVKPALKRSADLFTLYDDKFFDTDANHGSDALRNNLAYLSTEGRPLKSIESLDQMMAIAEAADCASLADLYEFEQRRGGYSGSDGVESDKQIHTALAVTAPLVSMVTRGRSARKPMTQLPTKGSVYVSTKDYDMRQTMESNSQLVRTVSAAQFSASTGADIAVDLALQSALAEEEDAGTFVAKAITIDQIESSTALVRLHENESVTGAGLERCRRFGLDKKETIDLALFASELNGKSTRAAVTKRYNERVNNRVDLVFDRTPIKPKMTKQSSTSAKNARDAEISLAFGAGVEPSTLQAQQVVKTTPVKRATAKTSAPVARKRKRAAVPVVANSKMTQTTLKF
jgi:hypothetical protein